MSRQPAGWVGWFGDDADRPAVDQPNPMMMFCIMPGWISRIRRRRIG